MSVTLQTSHGELKLRLHHTLAPLACRNFIELCKAGYYDGVVISKLVQGKYFVTGAPDPKRGKYGCSIYGPSGFKSEMTPKLAHDKAGVIGCWSESAINKNGSEFYITLSPMEEFDGRQAIFGECENPEILKDLMNVKVDKNNVPTKAIKIFGTSIVKDPWQGQALPVGAEIPEKVLVKDGDSTSCELM